MIYFLAGVIVLQSILHYFERKDLYGRINGQPKNNKPPAPYVESAHDKVLKRWRNGGDKR